MSYSLVSFIFAALILLVGKMFAIAAQRRGLGPGVAIKKLARALDRGPREASRVVGCSTAALRVRLHRARKRLVAALASSPEHAPRSVESVGMEWS